MDGRRVGKESLVQPTLVVARLAVRPRVLERFDVGEFASDEPFELVQRVRVVWSVRGPMPENVGVD